MRLFQVRFFAVFILFSVFISVAVADEYPTRPVTLIAPYGPGGAADAHARIIAATATGYLGQSLQVINKTGAGGVVGSSYVVRSKKDGYTLLSARVGSQASVPAVNPEIPYKWDDFTFLGLTERNPFVLIVPINSKYKNFAEIASAIKSGEELSFSSAGKGTLLHLASQIMADSLGVDGKNLIHVPYKGGGKARSAVVLGKVDMLWQNLSGVIELIREGKVRALAITTKKRVSAISDVPTVSELGYPKMETIIGWSGIFGPPDLPKPIADKWIQILAKLKSDKEFNKSIAALGSIPDIRNPEETRIFVKSQYQAFRAVARKLNMGNAQ
ncbi:MAG: Bug family tripartite tricarboxylate transporter substrate binding protein [Methyloligellaceae bacterium]